MRRVTIGELTELTGLSRATIDRALNGRGGVHPRTRQVIEEALRRLHSAIGAGPSPGLRPAPDAPGIDLLMRVGRGLIEQVKTALAGPGAPVPWSTTCISRTIRSCWPRCAAYAPIRNARWC